MATLVRILNGTNLTRDAGIQSGVSSVLGQGVRNGFSGELEVGGSGASATVEDGMAFIETTRTDTAPDEVFLVPVWVTAQITGLDIQGDGYVIISIDQTKVNDGSNNQSDGSQIATVEFVAALPSSNYLLLATVSSGTPTDARVWSRIKPEAQPDTIHYGNSSGSPNTYAITVNGVESYEDGQEFSVKADSANTGAITVNVNSLGATAVKKNNNVDLVSGDIPDNFIFDIKYNSDNGWFQLVSPIGQNPSTLDKASQSEAESKTDDTKYLTPSKGRGAAGTASTRKIYDTVAAKKTLAMERKFTDESLATGTYDVGATTSSSKQSFRCIGGGVSFSSIKLLLGKFGAPLDNLEIRIETDSSGEPSGTLAHANANASIAGTSLTTSQVLTTVTFAGSFALTEGTPYHLVLQRSSGPDPADYYKVSHGGVAVGQPKVFKEKTYNGSAWVVNSFAIFFEEVTARSFSTGLALADVDSYLWNNFECFSEESGVDGDEILTVSVGHISGLSSLLAGEPVFLSSTAGGVSTTDTGILIGYAISSSELFILKEKGGYDSGIISDLSTSATGDNDNDINVTGLNFTPKLIKLNFYLRGHDSAAGSAAPLYTVGEATWLNGNIKKASLMINNGISANFSPSTVNPRSSVDPTAGIATGTSAGKITLSIPSYEYGKFTIRRKTQSASGPAQAMIAYVSWEAYG